MINIANYVKCDYFGDANGFDNATLRLCEFSDFSSRHTVGIADDDIMYHILVVIVGTRGTCVLVVPWIAPVSMVTGPGGCFTNVSRALQNNLAKIHNARNHIYGKNFKLKLCMCAQSMALGTHTKFQLEILIRSTISAIHKFRENILESSRNVSETTLRRWHWDSLMYGYVSLKFG